MWKQLKDQFLRIVNNEHGFVGTTALAIGAGVSAAGQAASGAAAGKGEQKMAEARLREATSNRSQMLAAAEPSTRELAELDRQGQLLDKFLNIQEAGLDRQESIFSKIDPVFSESLKQSQDILQGKESALLSPVLRQRAQQREALVGSLRNQMGSGFESSTAGAQALARFDAETQGVAAETQQKTLGTLQNFAQGIGSLRSQQAQTAGSLSSQRISNSNLLANRKIGALQASDTSQLQGAEHIGGIAQAKAAGGLFGSIGSFAGGQLGSALESARSSGSRNDFGIGAPGWLTSNDAGATLGQSLPQPRMYSLGG